MIAFSDLKAMNTQYAYGLKEATARVIDVGWEADEHFETGSIKTIEWYLGKSNGI